MITEGKKYGYYVNESKSWLIVKSLELVSEANTIFGKSVNITNEGKRHLGAVIGSQKYKGQYCSKKVDTWVTELTTLTEMAKTQPQAAFVAFTKGYRSKFTYFLRTIDCFEAYVKPIDDILNDSFLSTIFGQDVPFSDVHKHLFRLTPSDGGLGIPSLFDDAPKQFSASLSITKSLTDSIINQETILKPRDRSIEIQSAKVN